MFESAVPDESVPTYQDPLALNILQMRLLHHYTTVTAQSLGASPDAQVVYATVVPQTAFEYPFLLHVILALAALHLSRLQESVDKAAAYAFLGGRYHDTALASFQATVRDIDESNFKAVLIFAAALFPYSCASSVDPNHDVDHAFETLLSNFALTRRVRPMVSSFYDAMKASVLEKLIPEDIKGIDWATQEPPIETELVQLRKFAEAVHHLYPPDIVDAYGYAVHILVLTLQQRKSHTCRPLMRFSRFGSILSQTDTSNSCQNASRALGLSMHIMQFCCKGVAPDTGTWLGSLNKFYVSQKL